MTLLQFWIRLIIYLVLFVVGIGGLGVWIPIVQIGLGSPTTTIGVVVSNLATLIISLSVTAYADFQLQSYSTAGKTQRLFFLGLMLSAALAGVCALTFQDQKLALKLAEVGAAIAVVIWIVVNATNPSFGEDTHPLAPLGGKV